MTHIRLRLLELLRYVFIRFNAEKVLPAVVVETGNVAGICKSLKIFGYISKELPAAFLGFVGSEFNRSYPTFKLRN